VPPREQTGAMQNFARKNKLPIDQIDFAFKMLTTKPGETPPPADGVHVHGMFLEGSRYSNETTVLEECEPKVLFTEIPMMWFQPMQVEEIDHGSYYNCPLYKESARRGVLATTGHSSNFVMFLSTRLPTRHGTTCRAMLMWLGVRSRAVQSSRRPRTRATG
jgi:dynein heavy chain